MLPLIPILLVLSVLLADSGLILDLGLMPESDDASVLVVLLSALCRQPILSDVEDCDDRSLAYIMVYTIPWSVCFFVVAMPWLKKVAAPPPDCEDRRPPFALLGLECNAAAWKAALCTGPMGGTAFGVLCALWPWLQDNLFCHHGWLWE